MTKEQFEAEISSLLSAVPHTKRKQVEGDTVFMMSIKEGNPSAALERAAGIIYGSGKKRSVEHGFGWLN